MMCTDFDDERSIHTMETLRISNLSPATASSCLSSHLASNMTDNTTNTTANTDTSLQVTDIPPELIGTLRAVPTGFGYKEEKDINKILMWAAGVNPANSVHSAVVLGTRSPARARVIPPRTPPNMEVVETTHPDDMSILTDPDLKIYNADGESTVLSAEVELAPAGLPTRSTSLRSMSMEPINEEMAQMNIGNHTAEESSPTANPSATPSTENDDGKDKNDDGEDKKPSPKKN